MMLTWRARSKRCERSLPPHDLATHRRGHPISRIYRSGVWGRFRSARVDEGAVPLLGCLG